MNGDIVFVRHQDIDYDKWDRTIERSVNSIVYAFSWYLDEVCTTWDALVGGKYECVMPLTSNTKAGIKYLYQPFFTQQLGVFSPKPMDMETIRMFIEAIPAEYRYVDISFNTHNIVPADYSLMKRTTYELELHGQYEEIFGNYSDNTVRNIKKAKENKLSIRYGLPVRDILALKKREANNLSDNNYVVLERLMKTCIEKNRAVSLGAFKDTHLCAAVFFVLSAKKAIYLVAVSDEQGKNDRAMFLLVDHFIKTHIGKISILDFEGSEIPGIARFFHGFSAKAVNYSRVKINRLPWYMRIWKK